MDKAIEHVRISTLTPWDTNARTHSKKQIRQLADSIETFGFTNPVLIDGENRILAGHGRVEAAKLLGRSDVPTIRFEHMTEGEKRAYVIADNKLALNAGWDDDLLAAELGELLAMPELSFDIGVIGFTIAEVDNLIASSNPEEPNDPADDASDFQVTPRTNPGDIWQLGRHRLICGDALDPRTTELLMDGKKARMVFSDPPYNVPIEGHVGNSGKTKHREFVMATGELSSKEFTDFLATALQNMASHSVDGAIYFLCMDWRHMSEIVDAGRSIYHELKNLIIWSKDNGGMGSFYRSRHELVFAFKVGTAPHTNSFELGQHGRYRTNVWEYAGVNTHRKGRMEELALHPTVKPVAMIADAIRDVSGRGDIVLDLFGGSGSTLIAAEKTGRVCNMCEIDPVYCDRIIARWEAYAKDEAVKLACKLANEPQNIPETVK